MGSPKRGSSSEKSAGEEQEVEKIKDWIVIRKNAGRSDVVDLDTAVGTNGKGTHNFLSALLA